MTLTPAKENADEEDVEEDDEEVTLVDDGEVDAPRKPLLWEVELLLTEQKEEDEEKDPEYVPPSTCLEISLDYDECSAFTSIRLYRSLGEGGLPLGEDQQGKGGAC